MKTKLVLELEQDLVDSAERYAEASGKSVSQIVAGYFAVLDSKATIDEASLPPITRSLSGILRGEDVDEQNYHAYLEDKFL